MVSEWWWAAFAVVGAALWWWSIHLTLGAYPRERVSYWANPRKAPRRAVASRAVGIGLTVFGVGMMPRLVETEPWAAALVAGGAIIVLIWVPYVVAIAAHNRRITAIGAPDSPAPERAPASRGQNPPSPAADVRRAR